MVIILELLCVPEDVELTTLTATVRAVCTNFRCASTAAEGSLESRLHSVLGAYLS